MRAAPGAHGAVVGPGPGAGGAGLLVDEGHAVERTRVLAAGLERVPREIIEAAAVRVGLGQRIAARTAEVIAVLTNLVVAICVVFVPDDAVGATGVPVKLGEASVA